MKISNAGQDVNRERSLTIGLVAKLAFSLVVLVVLFWKFRHDLPSLLSIDLGSTAAATALLVLQPPLVALRWWLLLRMYGSTASLRAIVGTTWISVFANQFLPASVGGDAVRIYYARRDGERLGAAAASVLVDRLVALFALALLLVAFGSALADLMDGRIIAALAGICLVAVVGALVSFRLAHSMSRLLTRWRTLGKGAQIVHYVLRVMAHPATGFAVVALAVVVHLISCFAFLLILRGMGVTVDAIHLLAASAALTFVQVVPISIGGWGVREVAAVSFLGLLGIEPGVALLGSVVLGLTYATASLPGAVIWPLRRAPT